MSSFLLKKKHMREALLFCLKKSATESHWMLVEAYGDNALLETMCRDWFRRFNDDNFNLSDKKRENRPRKVEDCQLQAPLDDTQSQKMFAEQLGVSQAAISMRLHAMGKVQKIGKWVPHELNDRQMERRQNTCQILLAKKESRSCIGLWQAMKSGSIFRILNARNLGLIPPNHQHLPQNQIASDGRRCCAFGGIRRMLRAIKIWWNC